MQFSPSGELLTLPTYTSMTNSETLLWELNDQTVKAKLKRVAVAFSPDGQQLLVQTDAQRLQICDVAFLKVRHEFVLGADETGPGHYRFWYAPRIDAPPSPVPALRAP